MRKELTFENEWNEFINIQNKIEKDFESVKQLQKELFEVR